MFLDPWGNQSFRTSKHEENDGEKSDGDQVQAMFVSCVFCMLSVLLFMVNIGNNFSPLTC